MPRYRARLVPEPRRSTIQLRRSGARQLTSSPGHAGKMSFPKAKVLILNFEKSEYAQSDPTLSQFSNYCSMKGVMYCKPHYEQILKSTGSLDKRSVLLVTRLSTPLKSFPMYIVETSILFANIVNTVSL